MDTIFTKIINKKIPGYFVYEDDVCVAIMDAFPSVPGQILVIPREPVDYVFDLSADIYQHIFTVSQKIAKVLDQVFETSRTCIVVEGFEVPHTHIKLYPLSKEQTALTDVLLQTKPADSADLEAQRDLITAAL
jgi:histidine triad (HIT) family protein